MQKRDFDTGNVCVSVHKANGWPLEKDAKVILVSNDEKVVLKRRKGSSIYKGTAKPDTYELVASSENLVSPERTVTVAKTKKTASAYLGKKDWPFYRYGENVVPFKVRKDLIAVCFETRPLDPETARRLIEEIAERFELTPFEHKGEDEKLPNTAADGAFWLFELNGSADRTETAKQIREMLGPDVRIGLPVDLTQKQVKVLDPRFVIRFRDYIRPKDIEEIVRGAGGIILRTFLQAGNARMVEFPDGDFRDHLGTVDSWFRDGLLVYGEPDLLAEIVDDMFPTDPPDDPTYTNQRNLTLQNADDAWQFLNQINSNLTLGSPNVYVASLDRGIDTDHSDIGGNLTDGQPQLTQCFDFRGVQPCTAPGYTPATDHGMGVYGIIAALTDNNNDMAGIAPNTHQLGLERPTSFSAFYADVLLWMAGFTTGNMTAGWPAEPINPAADIINCSHGQNGLALSGLMDDTLTFLSVYGRGGKGTVVVYSADNGLGGVAQQITGFRVFAAHPRTLAISNSLQPDGGGVQRLAGTSNFGPEIDICAQGAGAPSLNASGGEQNFGGTSAAAPTTAEAAALMLSVEPNLTWVDVRDILRNTAVTIDGTNTDPVGQYVSGFSWWYGFGRLDIDGAVRVADVFDTSLVNTIVRDNHADDGTVVPTGGTFWRSPDLWVRNDDPSTDPIGDPAYTVNPPNQAAIAGQDNWVRVRVRNVGSEDSSNVFVRAYPTHFAGSQFMYPTDYIPSINTGDPIPNPLVQATYLIGEQVAPTLAAGTDIILNFLWPAALVPPEAVGGTSWHPCLLAEASPHNGPDPSGNLVVDNTNLAQRNVTIAYSDDDGAAHEMTGVIGNVDDEEGVRRIVVDRRGLPKKAKIWVRFLDPKVERAALKWLSDEMSEFSEKPDHSPRIAPPTRRSDVLIETVRGERRFCLVGGSRLILHVPMTGGALTPVVLGAQLPKGTLKQAFDIPLIEQDLMGHNLGAFSLEISKH